MTHKLTSAGFQKLQDELKNRKEVLRVQLGKDYVEALATGDGLHDNFLISDSAALFQNNEHRVEELEKILSDYKIIETDNSIVNIGSTVKLLKNEQTEIIIQIVSAAEANPLENKISSESKLAMVLLNKKLNDVVNIETPSGITTYKILQIN